VVMSPGMVRLPEDPLMLEILDDFT